MKENAASKGIYQKAMNAAVRLLTQRDHTKYEVIQKLKKRAFDESVISRVVAECKRLNYIDDDRTAKLYIEQRIRKGFGANRIRMELKKKGVSNDSIQKILNISKDSIDEQQAADKTLQKKMKAFDREKDMRKRKEKIYRFLRSRGFSEPVISESIRKYG